VVINNVAGRDWAWSQAHQQYVKVIETAGLWGQQFYRVWLQQQDVVLKVLDTDLYNQPVQTIVTADTLCYLATAAKIANVQQEDTLLAPIESNVIPLPHQLKALTKAMSQKQVRYLFADEVGLGKTIEAGLVMRELKLRGLAKRILVCAPKGLVSQWVSEMQTHFNESFQLMLPGEQKPQNEHDNIWSRYDQVVCPVDSIKPIENRKGWSLKQLNEYNKLRFDDLLAAVGTLSSLMKPIGSAVAPTRSPVTSWAKVWPKLPIYCYYPLHHIKAKVMLSTV
jgi:hypothetical protein